MKRYVIVIWLFCFVILAGCMSTQKVPPPKPPSEASGNIMQKKDSMRIRITAGNIVLYADLFDNPTAESFVQLLPITLNTFDRIGLVKSTLLPQEILDEGVRTREYVRGAIFYWPEGSEVAFCYSDHLPETVVDIIHIGLIETGVELFETYTGELYIELAEVLPSSVEKRNYSPVNQDTFVVDVVNHPAFAGFGHFLFPTEYRLPDGAMKLENISSLLPYHSRINTNTTVEVINYMLDTVGKEETIFYDIYTDAEKRTDPTKEHTGLFFFRGTPDKAFAVISAGGGFSYVGSIHESFPHALELSKKGYNAFAVQYRTGGEEVACEDLAAAISFIFEHAQELKVDTDNYSLWGGSAGARMAAYLGSYGPAAFGKDELPRPVTVVMQYTGHSDYTPNDPATYACVGEQDGIASPRTMEKRIQTLRNLGVATEFHRYPNLGHGFGLGIGTSAEGWLNDAAAFWEKQINH